MQFLEIASQVIVVIFLAAAAPGLTLFWYFCLGNPEGEEVKKGRIFSSLGLWLDYRYHEFEKKENGRIQRGTALLLDQGLSGDAYAKKKLAIDRSRRLNWYKPLGCCPNCTSPYMTVLVNVPCYLVFGLSWWLFIPGLGLSGVFLDFFMKNRR